LHWESSPIIAGCNTNIHDRNGEVYTRL
jgi:hypothetical protein